MHIGIVGLPNSSKTTVFNALTRGQAETAKFSSARFSVQHAVVDVPDPRLDRLVELFKPRKITRARVEYHDIAGLAKGIGEGGLSGELLQAVAQNDALLHVVRAFDDDEVLHPEGDVDPARDMAILDTEFILSDLIIVEKRLLRLRESLKKVHQSKERSLWEKELALLERIQPALEAERPVRDLGLDAEETKLIRGFQLLSAKPMLVVFNTGDRVVEDPASLATVSHAQTAMATIRGQLEAELAQLDNDDRGEFMAEYGIVEAGMDRIIRASLGLLGLQVFFTAGEQEVRAWEIAIGATALDAAGAIHSDLARGFIRAEVTAFDDLVAAGGMAQARQAGTLRLEGRDYVVKDGDVLTIRFNV